MPTSCDNRLFLRHIADLADAAERQYVPRFTAFLNDMEQLEAKRLLTSGKHCYAFFGGADGCARQILGIYPDEAMLECRDNADFGACALTCVFRQGEELSHRDFLGSLMALGIKREMLGDIHVCDGYAIIFCTEIAARLILDEVSKIGRVGVRFEQGITREIPKQQYETLDCVVASLRADCIVGAVTKLSREKACDLIRAGAFTLCCEECVSTSKTVDVNDVFSVKGYGKFVLSEIGANTSKGRLHIKIYKYI